MDPFMIVIEVPGGTFWEALAHHRDIPAFVDAQIAEYGGVGESGVFSWTVYYRREDFGAMIDNNDYLDDGRVASGVEEWDRCIAGLAEGASS